MSLTYRQIRGRLDRLGSLKKAAAAPAPVQPMAPKPGIGERPCSILHSLSSAELRHGDDGRFLLLRKRVPLASSNFEISADALARLSSDFSDGTTLRSSEICFLDTETTGLAGSGALAFQVGLGWLTSDGFQLEQYLIEDYCHEREMLCYISERLMQFRAVCTYNGRPYDMPLLAARALINRLPHRPFRLPNLDLLPFCRRLWRGVFPNCRLKTIEREALGIDRGPDIDGAEIPQIFFALAAAGDHPAIPQILSHNEQDIASLALLLARLAVIADDPLTSGALQDHREFCAAARWLAREGALTKAAQCLERAALCSPTIAAKRPVLWELSLCRKRLREWPAAIELWREIGRGSDCYALSAWEELAKYYEHVAQDLPKAQDSVRQAQRHLGLLLDMQSYLGGPALQTTDDCERWEKRNQRIMRKIASQKA